MKIAVVGLGYVGRPLFESLSKHFDTVGFDLSEMAIRRIKANNEHANVYTNKEEIEDCDLYVIAVPTPVKDRKPDLSLLLSATRTVGSLLSENNIVVYESTVAPGTTEDICLPILENLSGLSLNKNLFIGYSPERINPGDDNHTIDKVTKVISASNESTLELMRTIYSKITGSVYEAKSIKVAEMSKLLENVQRDVNIALMNEMAMLCKSLNLDSKDVLETAETKWNFSKYYPGLVGGHCISVDPYYMIDCANTYKTDINLVKAARVVNDNQHDFVSKEILRKANKIEKVLMLGITFKENCDDIRNSRNVDLALSLCKHTIVDVYDPVANSLDVYETYGISLLREIHDKYDVVVIAVPHKEILCLNVFEFLTPTGIVYDVKSSLLIEHERLFRL